ncbi:MAG: hypothetical protein IPM21_16135 [Acidobacteria bacterium]|nr:hypothetical protein [Acidobacteriota bacterium]
MKPGHPISKTERVLLLSFSFMVFAIFAAAIFAEEVQIYRASLANEFAQLSGRFMTPTVPMFHLITFLIFLALFRTKEFIISISLTVVYLVLLLFSIWERLDGGGALGGENFYTNRWLELSMKTNHYDYLAAFAIIVLFVWQATILWRKYLSARGATELT